MSDHVQAIIRMTLPRLGESSALKFSVKVERTAVIDKLTFNNAIAGWFCILHIVGLHYDASQISKP